MRNTKLLFESATDRFIEKTILSNLPDNAKPYLKYPLSDIIQKHPNALNGININTSQEVLQKYGHLPLCDFIRISICQMFDINHGKGPIKYMRGIFRIMLDELKCLSHPDMDKINKLKDDVMYIMQASENGDKETSMMDGNLNGLDANTIHEKFKAKRKEFLAKIRGAFSNKEYNSLHKYKKVAILNHEDAVQFQPYVSWCIAYDNSTNYDSYVGIGGRFYIFLRDDYKKYPKEGVVGNNCPYDDFGLSMVSVLVSMDGNISIITTRWNHAHDGELNHPNSENIEMICNMMGVNLFKECPPYTREELRARGIVPFEDVPEMLENGVDPNEIFDKISTLQETSDGPYLCEVKLNNKYNLLKNDRLLYNEWYDYIGIFHNGFATIERNGKYGFINTEGIEIGDGCVYDYVTYFCNGFAKVKRDGKRGFINTEGIEIGKGCVYDNVYKFSNGFATIERNGKYGFINTEGIEIGDGCVYDYVTYFCNGFAIVERDGKYGYINIEGIEIGDGCVYDYVYDFYNGFAKVIMNGNWYYIDTEGKYYDYNTRQPIPNPLHNTSVNEVKKKNIYLTEKQYKALIETQTSINESKRYPFDPNKVLIVKRYLDNGYIAQEWNRVGNDGFPVTTKIVTMLGNNREPLKNMFKEQMLDLLVEKFKNMFSDKEERERFLKQVLEDWINNKISVHGMLSKNYV